jgi:hypothetical protein
MTVEAFRRLALSMPEACEMGHMGHPDFRVRGRIFATLGYPDAAWGMVKLTPEQQAALVGREPAVFEPVKGGWGVQGATNVRLWPARSRSVRLALALAWENVRATRAASRPGRVHPGAGRGPSPVPPPPARS